MMYLEDYLESIEDLPVACRDMLVTIRELDLVVQNALDKKTEESEEFLRKAGKMRPGRRESVYQSLKADFAKILEDADEKINVVEKLESILVNSLRQLDREIAKFKTDLEDANPGCTSAIEERVAKSEVPVPKNSDGKTSTQKRKRSKKTKKKSRKKSSTSSSTVSSVEEEVPTTTTTKELAAPILEQSVQEEENVVNNTADAVPEVPLDVEPAVLPPSVEMTYDPTPYCICNQVAYGEMIACDNPSCPHEWFHYACVNLTTAPEGTWYCPKCNVCQ